MGRRWQRDFGLVHCSGCAPFPFRDQAPGESISRITLSMAKDDWCGLGIAPGSPTINAALGSGWFLESVTGHFTLVCNGAELPLPDGVCSIDLAAISVSEVVAERLALDAGAAMLIRPDHYVAARWKRPDAEHVCAALLKAQGR